MSIDESSLIRLNCIGDTILRDLLEGEALESEETCDHYGELGRSVTLGRMADAVDERYRELFIAGQELPVFCADSDNLHYEQAGRYPAYGLRSPGQLS